MTADGHHEIERGIDENCPVFLTRAKVIHVGFDDPPKLAKQAPTEEAAMDCYRRVRDEIRSFIENDFTRRLTLDGC